MKLHKAVTDALLNGRSIMKLDCPKTPLGLIDLRGYAAPKDIKRVKSRKGNWNSFVHESIRIKKQHLEGVDLSYSDLEACEFFKSSFSHCQFEEVNVKETKFWGCLFDHSIFKKTAFTHAVFQPFRVFFPERRINFNEVRFDHCNLTGVYMEKQGLAHCLFIQSKTTNLHFYRCQFNQVHFTGTVEKLQLSKNKIDLLDLEEAKLSGMNLEEQALDGIRLPDAS